MRTMRRACAAAIALACLPAGCGGDEETVCAGSATLCSSLDTAAACVLQAGCTPESRCTGVPTACDDEPAEESCSGQPGCAWQFASCDGIPLPCESFARLYDGPDCARQLGCTWDSATRVCSGTAAGCGPLDQAACREQNGCIPSSGCAGSTTSCSTWVTAADCGTSGGCRWNADRCAGTATECSDLPVDLCAWQEGCHVE